ncbi:hypothetical protein V5E97_19355 [Singulisphaera sp. Ch08]|uniref:Tetratricopeptide repeat protein n=1 Tax=Singulisphaera sp. Ch08 TaxID=3120278 RepID=A0AAU7CSK1_9BACT
MRRPIVAVVAGLMLSSLALTAGAFEWPIPQDPEKARKARDVALAWTKKTLADAYEEVGIKDPRWNELVRDLMKTAVPLFVELDDIHSHDQVYLPAKKAIEAGCNDPIVLYIYARTSSGHNYPGPEEYERRFTTAASALEASAYPPIRKAIGLMHSADLKLYHKEQSARDEARRCYDAALALFPESAKADGLTPFTRQLWLGKLETLCDNLGRLTGDSKTAYEQIDAVLEKVPAAKSVRMGLRGKFYVSYAWEARTAAAAVDVTEDGMRKFGERAAEARRALQDAWRLDPDDSLSATEMITVEMAIGEGDRGVMEKWFQRAMEADSNNLRACTSKLLWLEPKWHGSVPEMISFARACRDTKNWRSRITLLPAEVYRRLGMNLPTEAQTKFFRIAEIWEDIRGVYVDYLTHDPEDDTVRSDYAGFCYLCGHYDEAHAQFQKVGDRLSAGHRFTEKWLKEVRYATAERVRGDVKPGRPPAKGLGILAANYGAEDRWVDITKSAQLNVANDRLNITTNGLPDPLFGRRKTLAIAYSTNGRVGLSITTEKQEASLPPKDVAEAKLAEVPPQGFAVLAASFGDDDKWVDVTEAFRQRTQDGKLDSSAADLPDPVFGVHKSLVIVYAWQGKVLMSITRDDAPVSLPVIEAPRDR